MSILEAMSTGLAVVSTEHGRVLEIIENGVSGMLVPAQDVSALASSPKRWPLGTILPSAPPYAATATIFVEPRTSDTDRIIRTASLGAGARNGISANTDRATIYAVLTPRTTDEGAEAWRRSMAAAY